MEKTKSEEDDILEFERQNEQEIASMTPFQRRFLAIMEDIKEKIDSLATLNETMDKLKDIVGILSDNVDSAKETLETIKDVLANK